MIGPMFNAGRKTFSKMCDEIFVVPDGQHGNNKQIFLYQIFFQ